MSEVKREYYNSGELRYEVFVINDIKNGTYKEYFPNGQLAEMHTYIDNKLNGKFESYYRNGKLSCECTYTVMMEDYFVRVHILMVRKITKFSINFIKIDLLFPYH